MNTPQNDNGDLTSRSSSTPAPSMRPDVALSLADVHRLQLIEDVWVSASYWDDDTIRGYQALGLLACDGVKISLTSTGRRACGRTAPVLSLYHPI